MKADNPYDATVNSSRLSGGMCVLKLVCNSRMMLLRAALATSLYLSDKELRKARRRFLAKQ